MVLSSAGSVQRRKGAVVATNFDFLRSQDKWFDLERAFPAGAHVAHLVHRLVVSVIEEINSFLVDGGTAFRVHFNVPKKVGRNAKLTISTFGTGSRRKNVPLFLSDFSILFADEKLVLMNSESSLAMLVQLIVGEIERFSAAVIDAAASVPR
jgi:hypothetical protein